MAQPLPSPQVENRRNICVESGDSRLENLLLGKHFLEAFCLNCLGKLCSLEPGAQGHHHNAHPSPNYRPVGSWAIGDQGLS